VTWRQKRSLRLRKQPPSQPRRRWRSGLFRRRKSNLRRTASLVGVAWFSSSRSGSRKARRKRH
jgi:hypothetical protein